MTLSLADAATAVRHEAEPRGNGGDKERHVAVASRDGKVVQDHFGRATQFIIFSLTGTRLRFVEARTVAPLCAAGQDPEHSAQSLAELVDSLADCAAVFVARIGSGPRQALEARGIRVFESPGLIDEAIAAEADHLLNEPA